MRSLLDYEVKTYKLTLQVLLKSHFLFPSSFYFPFLRIMLFSLFTLINAFTLNRLGCHCMLEIVPRTNLTLGYWKLISLPVYIHIFPKFFALNFFELEKWMMSSSDCITRTKKMKWRKCGVHSPYIKHKVFFAVYSKTFIYPLFYFFQNDDW